MQHNLLRAPDDSVRESAIRCCVIGPRAEEPACEHVQLRYEMMRELDAHILDARMDESVHVLLLTGAGEKFFCAGADIAMLEKANPYFK